MYRFIFIILILFSTKESFCQKTNEELDSTNIIHWHDNLSLEWSDFLGKPDSTIKASYLGSATAASAFHFGVEYTSDSLEMPNYKVYNCFIREESFIIDPAKASRHLLEHEKLHFDLYEVYARRIRKGIHQLRKEGNRNIEDYQKLIDRLLDESEKANKLYDKETAYSNLRIMQEEWKIKIMKELELLKDFK
jgi:hypothetical protein